MPRVFLDNFDFENELAAPPSSARAAGAGDLFWAWLGLAEAGDCILAPGHVDTGELAPLEKLGLPIPRFVGRAFEPDAPADYELVPWGWTAWAQRLAESRGWRCAAPPLAAVREANRRSVRFALECEWNIGLTGAALAGSLGELVSAVANLGDRPLGWLLKAEFGMSGREAIRGRGAALDERSRNWAEKRLQNSGPIVVEPLVERVAEAGIQIEISPAGPPALIGVTPLVVDRSGVYRGSRFGELGDEIAVWQPAVEIALRAAQKVCDLGFFGPLGIDAMQYRDEAGEIRMRPLQDLNARFTMGRLALGFVRVLPPGWCGTWLHFGARHLAGREPATRLADLARQFGAVAVPASPGRVSGREFNHRAALLLAPTAHVLHRAEAAICGDLGIHV